MGNDRYGNKRDQYYFHMIVLIFAVFIYGKENNKTYYTKEPLIVFVPARENSKDDRRCDSGISENIKSDLGPVFVCLNECSGIQTDNGDG